jgi:hypothetical protein
MIRAWLTLSLVALALSCGQGDAKIGRACATQGDDSECDSGEVCAPKNAGQSLLECSVICDKDVDCGPAEHCTAIKGKLKACTLQ